MKKTPLIFSLKVWVTATIVGTLLAVFLMPNFVLSTVLGYGFLLSLPSFLIFCLATFMLCGRYEENRSAKITLSFISTLLAFFAFYLLPKEAYQQLSLLIPIIYSIITIVSIWLYPLGSLDSSDEN